jgi:dihydropteroate synthase
MSHLDDRRPALVIRGRSLPLGQRTLVMGIVNVTPDSFSGDGLLAGTLAQSAEAAAAQAHRMVGEGADLIDVGGESTRPGHTLVGTDDETARVVDAISAIRGVLPDVPISVDTSKPDVAHAGLRAGADILNDVAAVTSGAALAAVAADHAAPYIVMHSRSTPAYADLLAEVSADLGATIERALAAGCDRSSLIVDPGIGFGKTAEQNLTLLRRLGELRSLGVPMLLGTSRKSTIGKVLDLPPHERLEGTLATTALGIAAGVDIVRVHDVSANVRVARMADAIVRGGWHDAPDDTPPATGERQ